MSDQYDGDTEYEYAYEGQRQHDDRHAARARDLARDGIISEARREAGKIEHYGRSCDLLDDISRQERRRARPDGGQPSSDTERRWA